MFKKPPVSFQYLIDSFSGSPVINIAALEAGHFPKDNTKSAVYFKGKMAIVFAFQVQKQLKAVKIWTSPENEYIRKRYAIAEKHIARLGLGYFVKSFYLEGAITFGDTNFDILLMDWVGRQNVKEYIYANIDQPENIHALAEKILRMHKALNHAGVSHGHFHTGNIYIDASNELKLIGYDALYIKEEPVDGAVQLYPDYTHPSDLLKGMQADYFAALIIYLGCKVIAHDSVLWGRYKVGFQEGFLFNAQDFIDVKNSVIYKQLRKINVPEINKLLDILLLYCQETNPQNLKPFYTYLDKDSINAAPYSAPKQEIRITKKSSHPFVSFPENRINESNTERYEQKTDAVIEVPPVVNTSMPILLPDETIAALTVISLPRTTINGTIDETYESKTNAIIETPAIVNKNIPDLLTDEIMDPPSVVSVPKSSIPENEAEINNQVAAANEAVAPVKKAKLFALLTDRTVIEAPFNNQRLKPRVEQIPDELPVIIPSTGMKHRSNFARRAEISKKNKKHPYQEPRQIQKKRAFVDATVICLFILASGYFFGELADKFNAHSFQPGNQPANVPDETKKTAAPLVKQKRLPVLIINKQASDSSQLINHTAIASPERIIENTAQVISPATNIPLENKRALLKVNSAAEDTANTIAFKNAAQRSFGKYNRETETHDSSAFKIGAPPKE